MAVPNSGPLGLRAQIGNEFYGNVTGSDISIHEMSQAEGFETPDTFSEFYGYSSAVTVTLDGGQSRTGAPGSGGFGSMTYNVTAPSGNGFTNSDANAASINAGLPTPTFSANFNRTGTSTGRWSISTPDGNFPNDSYALQSGDWTISQPSTPLYTLSVTFSGTYSGTSTSTVFQGSNASVGRSQSHSTVGLLYTNGANVPSLSSTLTANPFGGPGTTTQGANITRTMNSNFSGNATVFAPGNDTWARTPSAWVAAPPWGNPTGVVQNGQTFYQFYYPNSTLVDPRVTGNIRFNGPFGQTEQGTPISIGNNNQFKSQPLPGTGTFSVSLHSNHPHAPDVGGASSPYPFD